MAMTTDPEAKKVEYLGRFFRADGSDGGKMVHAQRDTLDNLAVLAFSARCRVSIVRGNRVIGNMTPDGLIDWFE